MEIIICGTLCLLSFGCGYLFALKSAAAYLEFARWELEQKWRKAE